MSKQENQTKKEKTSALVQKVEQDLILVRAVEEITSETYSDLKSEIGELTNPDKDGEQPFLTKSMVAELLELKQNLSFFERYNIQVQKRFEKKGGKVQIIIAASDNSFPPRTMEMS